MVVTMNKTLTFTKTHPNTSGQYLIKWLKGDYEVITVVSLEEKEMYGCKFEGGLFIPTWGGKHVSHINLDMAEGIAKL